MPVAERTLRRPEGWMGVRGTPALSPALRAGAASPRRAPLTILGAGGVRVPRPAPRARHYEGRFASALSPREKGREDANASRNVAVCLSVCPSVPHLRLTWSPHNRSQTGREEATRKPAGHTTGDPSVAHAFFSRSPHPR